MSLTLDYCREAIICDPFLENLHKRADNIFSDLLSCTAYLSYGASFDAILAAVLII